MIYALDTNIILRYLREDANVCHNFDDAIDRGCDIIIPKMVDYEILRGFRIMSTPSPKKESAYKILTEQCKVTSLDEFFGERVVDVYAGLYHKGFTVGDMDILIAAFCLDYNCMLVTNNSKDFKNVDGLIMVDWTLTST